MKPQGRRPRGSFLPHRCRPSARSPQARPVRPRAVQQKSLPKTPQRQSRSLTPLYRAQSLNHESSLATRPRKIRRVKRVRRSWGLILRKTLAVSTLGVATGLLLILPFLPPSSSPGSVSETRPTRLPNQTAQMSFGRSTELAAQVQFPLRQELTELQTRVAELAGQYGRGAVGVFVLDFDTGDYVSWNGRQEFMAASTIKLPLLSLFFQGVDRGKIALSEPLVMTPELIVGEAGQFQYQPPGSQFSALETATQMITVSDNTATNMIIQRLGGQERINQRLRQQGLVQTRLNSSLPDIAGTNLTSPVDLANVLIDIEQGEGLSIRSRDRILRILAGVINDQLLPMGLVDQEAAIAHKTGTIGKLLADAGLVDMPNGKRYLTVVMVERPDNDPAARTLIQQISREVYDYFSTSAQL
ncbi:MAG: serine hydrolase [Spirulinaceae cyanobacterium]